MHQTVELPQVQHSESIVDRMFPLPVAVRDHAPWSRRSTTLTVGAMPSTSHPDSSESTSGASDSERPADRGGPTGAVSEIVDTAVPQIVKAETVEVVKVIPQERGSERTVEQIAHVPAEIPRARAQQRTVEFGTKEVPEKCTALSQKSA